MSLWDIIDASCRLFIVTIVVLKLLRFHSVYRLDERWGLGFLGGGAVLTFVGLLPLPHVPPWPHALFAVGVAMYVWGRYRRMSLMYGPH